MVERRRRRKVGNMVGFGTVRGAAYDRDKKDIICNC